MRIKFTEFAADPKLRGTIANHPAHIAQSLIAQGAAVAVPYTDFRQRLAAEATSCSDKPDPLFVKGTEWSIFVEPRTGRNLILRKSGSETTRYEPTDVALAISHGCPPSVAGLLKSDIDLENLKDAAAYASEKAKQEREAAERLDRVRTGASLYTLGKRLVKPQ
jgi:hypothetical protein